MYTFKSLETYNKTVQITAMIKLAVNDFPRSTNHFGEGLMRASEEIYKNFALAHAKGNENEQKSFFWKSRSAVQECMGLIEVASRQSLFSPALRDLFRIELDHLNKEIQDLIRGPSTDRVSPVSPDEPGVPAVMPSYPKT